MIEILTMFVVGFVVGGIASFVMPGAQPMSAVGTTLLGIVGAFLGGWGGQALGLYKVGGPVGWIGAVVGALIALFLYRTIARRA